MILPLRRATCRIQRFIKEIMENTTNEAGYFLRSRVVDNAKDHDKSAEKEKVKSKKRKRSKKKVKEEGEETVERERPNVFVAVQIRNPEIHKKLALIQRKAIEHSKVLVNFYEPIQKAHLTLFVAHINDEDLAKVAEKMEESFSKNLKDLFKELPLTLHLGGLNNFNSRVVFADVVFGTSDLRRISDCLAACLKESGVYVKDEGELQPHLTLFKVGYQKKNEIKPLIQYFNDITVTDMGKEVVESVQLLSMHKKDDDGYYKREGEFFFERQWEPPDYSDHTSCCKDPDYLGLINLKKEESKRIRKDKKEKSAIKALERRHVKLKLEKDKVNVKERTRNNVFNGTLPVVLSALAVLVAALVIHRYRKK